MELGGFLRNRRGLLRPEDVGLVPYGSRRRVPGLRREELAALAGVSVDYYTRLEQGQNHHVSDSVLDALARALRLSEDEYAHLRDLARPAPPRHRTGTSRAERARPGLRQTISAMRDTPALLVDRRSDILAWNPLGHALVAGHLDAESPSRSDRRPNLARLLFLDPDTRRLYALWEEEARIAVGFLRVVAGRYPDDRRLAELVGELSMKSPEFAALWSRHPVRDCVCSTKVFDHPRVGTMELQFENLTLPDGSGQRMVVYSAEPDSASDLALRALASGTDSGRLATPRPAVGV